MTRADDTPSEEFTAANGCPRKCMGKINAELGIITQHNILQLRKLNEAVFPVSYNDKFYKDVISSGELAKFVYFNDCVVGAVCCRLDMKDNEKCLYIMTLATLAPYRRFGLGRMMLDHVFSLCRQDSTIKRVMLHVQVNNDSALGFYERYGFQKTALVNKYYKRIEPDSAFLLEKGVNGGVIEPMKDN